MYFLFARPALRYEIQKTDIVPDKWYNHDDAYDGTGNKNRSGIIFITQTAPAGAVYGRKSRGNILWPEIILKIKTQYRSR